MAPTCTGEVFIYNLKTGQVTGVLKDHDGKTNWICLPLFFFFFLLRVVFVLRALMVDCLSFIFFLFTI